MVSGRYTSTPLTYRDYTLTPNGSAYGVRKDCRNLVLTMLSSRTPIPNLLLTGQNLMLPGLEGVAMTALLTCADLIGNDKIQTIIKD
jgi:all-trans-retinol 13,14-reductase